MFKTKDEFKQEYARRIVESYGRNVEEAHITEKFLTLENMVRDYASLNWAKTKFECKDKGHKQVHYFSMEFLIGRLLVNNMMNLGIYDIAKEGLEELNINIHDLEELETDAGLGNGGLGRLAACFMDSLASLSYPAYGHTLRYEYGLFKQKIVDGYQVEVPDQWLKYGNAWEVRKAKRAVEVPFYGHVEWDDDTNRWVVKDAEYIKAVPYDMPVVGNDTAVTDTLRLWHAECSENVPGHKDFRVYEQEVREICQTLYPDDSTVAGRTLRLKQEYFFVSAGLHSIVKSHIRTYGELANFADKNVIQLNDTHPVLAIPELMRILMDEQLMSWDDSWAIVSKACAYTNHTILAEALEKWPVDTMRTVLPRIYQIIEEINRRFEEFVKEETNNNEEILNKVRIIQDGQVHMGRLAISSGFSVNGVAALHTKILMEQEMKEFNDLYPGKFNNKTNGITHRRWLAYSNPELTSLLNETIGNDWVAHPEKLEDLMKYVDDKKVQDKFYAVKQQRKQVLADYIWKHNKVKVDVDSIFDIQVKRLHAYKRQLLNILHVIYLYQEIKSNPDFKMHPRTFIFGAKAAPAYYFAKKVIKLINSVADVVNNDPEVSKYIKVVFLENYGVTLAEKIMPAANVSEQISTAGKEASGTGNMKFMMNGAVTVGTLDGANVEMSQVVGDDNIVIFGLKDDEIQRIKAEGSYNAWDYYNNNYNIKRVVDSLVDGTFCANREEFKMIYDELMNKNDEYFLFADFDSYKDAQAKIDALYQDKEKWAHMCLVNIAQSGFFSSDRTIEEYVRDIWHLTKAKPGKVAEKKLLNK